MKKQLLFILATIVSGIITAQAPVASFTIPSIFYKCTPNERLQTYNTTSTVSGANTYTWSIQPSSGVSIAPPGVNGENIAVNITNTTITVYTVTLRATNSSGSNTAVQTVTVDFFCLGIEQNNELANNLLIYPNPSHDIINMTLPPGINSVSLYLANILGEIVLEEKAIASAGETVSLKIGNRPKGVYFLTVEANGERATKRIMLE